MLDYRKLLRVAAPAIVALLMVVPMVRGGSAQNMVNVYKSDVSGTTYKHGQTYDSTWTVVGGWDCPQTAHDNLQDGWINVQTEDSQHEDCETGAD